MKLLEIYLRPGMSKENRVILDGKDITGWVESLEFYRDISMETSNVTIKMSQDITLKVEVVYEED